jgi:hypothetical protein
VEELVHECVGKLGDVRLDLGIDVAEMAKRPANLLLADHLGLPPELGDERLELELSVAATEDGDFLLDERLDPRHLGETRCDGVVEARAEVVDVEQLDARDVRCLPLDVRGNGEVDEDERPVLAFRHRGPHHARLDDGHLRARGRDRDVGPGERFLELVQPVRVAGKRRSRVDGALPRAVRHRDRTDAPAGSGPEGLEPDPPCSDDQRLPPAQVTERSLAESESHGARRCRVRADGGLDPSVSARRDRSPEEE